MDKVNGGNCYGCGKQIVAKKDETFAIMKESLEDGLGREATDVEVALTYEYCMKCATGKDE